MASSEKFLHQAAEDGSLDAADWPETLKYILDRLDDIVSSFPKPPRSSSAPTTPSRRHPDPQPSSQDSHATDKENALPRTPARPPVPGFTPSEPPSLPQDILTFYSTLRTALTSNFPTAPPHTIQRLSELILAPHSPYKHLPPYLRALDRVISVSSPATLFPLPQAVLPSATGLLNGATPSQASLGSDESLGGALLTPIPWLQNRGSELVSESTEMVDGPNGAGRIETVTVSMLSGGGGGGGQAAQGQQVTQIASSHPEGETLPSTGPVTQGEILRQEQEAGVVLNNPHTLTGGATRIDDGGSSTGPGTGTGTGNGAQVLDTVEPEDEQPHARGPEIIGMEDTGPQGRGGLDIEGAVGRPSVGRGSRSPQPEGGRDEEMGEGGKGDGDEEMKTV